MNKQDLRLKLMQELSTANIIFEPATESTVSEVVCGMNMEAFDIDMGRDIDTERELMDMLVTEVDTFMEDNSIYKLVDIYPTQAINEMTFTPVLKIEIVYNV